MNFLNDLLASLIGRTARFIDLQKLKFRELASSLAGNARVMTLTEFNWAIPLTWIAVYSPLFMKGLGLSSVEIGLVIGLGILTQALAAALGGVLADRWGHKRTLIIFDALGWPVAMVLFAFAQNIWWIAAATVINNLCFVVAPGWQCVFVEHTPKTKRANIYAVYQIVINLSNLAVPLAGLIVGRLGLVDGCRFIFAFTAVTTTAGILLRLAKLKDTKASIAGLKAGTARQPLSREITEFKSAFSFIRSNSSFLWFIAVQTLVMFGLVMWGTYYPIFLADKYGLGLSASAIPVFPFVFSIVMMAVLLLFIPHVRNSQFKRFITIGLFLVLAAMALFIVSPAHTMSFILLASVLNGAGTAFFRPLADTYNINAIPERARARVLSVLNTVIILATIPAAPLAGKLYSYEPRYAFAAVTLFLFLALILLLAGFRPNKEKAG